MWRPNVYSKPDSNLIPSPGIKTRQDTAQHLDFLYLNLKRNQWFIREDSLLTTWTCFHAECVLHSQEETPERLFLLLHQSAHGPCGGRVTASKLARGGCWVSCPPHVKGTELPYPTGAPTLPGPHIWADVWVPSGVGQKVLHPRHIFPLSL